MVFAERDVGSIDCFCSPCTRLAGGSRLCFIPGKYQFVTHPVINLTYLLRLKKLTLFNSFFLLLNTGSAKAAGRKPSLFFFSSILCSLPCLLSPMQGMERDSRLKSEAHISCVRLLMKPLLLIITLNWGPCKSVLSSEGTQTLSGHSAFSIKQWLNPAQYHGAVHSCGHIPVEEMSSFCCFFTHAFSVLWLQITLCLTSSSLLSRRL